MGKSTLEMLKNVGGQNPIDAAKLGCKYTTVRTFIILKKLKS